MSYPLDSDFQEDVRKFSKVIIGAGSGNRTRTLSLEGSYDTISPYPHSDSG